MLNNWEKFLLLMWKNHKIHEKHRIQLVCTILVPLLFSVFLLIQRSQIHPKEHPNPTTYGAVDIKFTIRSYEFGSSPISKWQVAYYPKSSCLTDVIQYAEEWINENLDLKISPHITFVGYDSIYMVEREVTKNKIIAGIQFDESFRNENKCPKKLKYAIRFHSELRNLFDKRLVFKAIANWETNSNFEEYDYRVPRTNIKNYADGKPSYYYEGFIGIQHALALGFINKYKTDDNVSPSSIIFKVQKFPFPPHREDQFVENMRTNFGILTLIGYIFPTCQIVKILTTEKEKQLKEVMNIMGLSYWLQWLAWFCYCAIPQFISVFLSILMYKIPIGERSVLKYSNAEVLIFCFIVYSLSLITFSFMIVSFFTKSNAAVFASIILWFISALPCIMTYANYKNMSLASKVVLSLFSNTAMGYCLQLIAKYEAKEIGLNWTNLFHPVNSDDSLSVGILLIMLLLDTLLYMLIALYVEKTIPGSFGASEKWYFPFTKGFWFPNSKKFEEIENAKRTSDASAFEMVEKNRKVGLAIENLRKSFDETVVVKSLTLDLYEDDITVLLGHNGAGKTTLISMLSGMIQPTSGTVILNGYDIRTNLMNARSSLGICTQNNVLFDELTVRDHITFFSRLKGMKNEEVLAEIDKYVELLKLEKQLDSTSNSLSDGYKRTLSVATALCGGSKVVLCDEPTSGMDLQARRALWNLLECEKKGRTILLTTHFMDEADYLGDRIAIMWNGLFRACGSSFYLKKKYGTGYHLICVKKQGCDTSRVTEFLKIYDSDVFLERDIGTELIYLLPEENVANFEEMLAKLEEEMEELQIAGFCISSTTLEEVFMLLGSEGINKNARSKDEKLHTYNNETGFKLNKNHWEAMLMKKFLYIKRNYQIFLLLNSLVISFLIVMGGTIKTFNPIMTLKPLQLDMSHFTKSITAVELKNVPMDGLEETILIEYKKYIQSFGNDHQYISIEENFDEYIIKLRLNDFSANEHNLLIGSLVESNQLTALFNPDMYHSLPLSLNTIHNAVLRATTSDPEFTILLTNHPFKYLESSKKDNLSAKIDNNLISTSLAFLMSLISAYYIIFPIKERTSRSKLLQFVSGIRVLTFWFSHLAFDFLTYSLSAIITTLIIACFQLEYYSTGPELGRLFLIFFFFGLGSLLLIYLLSFVFDASASGFIILQLYNIISGCIIFLPHLLDVQPIPTVLSLVPCLFLFSSTLTTSRNSDTTYRCLRTCDFQPVGFKQICNMDFLCKYIPNKKCCVPGYFDWHGGLAPHITYVCLGFILSLLILLIIEYCRFNEAYSFIERTINQKFYKKKLEKMKNQYEDDDVKMEKLKISRMSREDIKNTNLVLNQITKFYGKKLAVKQISATVQSFECFGLLGLNGAGKTSTFKMLTGDKGITYGEAYVKGFSVKNDKNSVYREIGYCPQSDALIDELTARETLTFFALLRGIPKQNIKLVNKEYAKAFGLIKHIDKRVSTYNGGSKRKLSTAIAFMGNPTVVCLDEPTTGMDPSSKLYLWDIICEIRNSGKSIVLTSHSMKECEALCTRFTIMESGEFKCLGSTQYIKTKYSKGIVLKIKIVKNENNNNENSPKLQSLTETKMSDQSSTENKTIDKITKFVKSEFKQAEIRDIQHGILIFDIPLDSVKWSTIFGVMETNKEKLEIKDYSISRTSLEEIFLDICLGTSK